MNKASIRKVMLIKRQNLDPNFIYKASKIICSRFEILYGYCEVFLMYYPIKCEVDTFFLIKNLYEAGKEVYLPCVDSGVIVFRRFEGSNSLSVGSFGVYEPSGKILEVNPEVIVIPALAYDLDCNRIGYGKGFYDKFLYTFNNTAKVGFAFDFQIVDNVFATKNDISVDLIITEERMIEKNQRL